MNLQKIRDHIDELDREILSHINERMELALRTAKLKEFVADKERETQVLDQVARYTQNQNHLVQGDFVRALYGDIIDESRRIQEKKQPLIGFQGEHGAFGELAGRRYNQGLIPIPCEQFEDVFDGVEKGWLDCGIVPVENSIGGAVTTVNDLMIQRNLSVIGAIRLRINHCLLTLPETNYQDIRIVYSHPQALSQCRDFIERHRMEARPFYDTAGAARMLSQDKPGMSAAIASELCAGLYRLEMIKDRIEDHAFNYTRFLVLAKEPQTAPADKCSIIFSTPNKAGALFEVLEIFARAGINLTRIESFPCHNDPRHSVFFLDFQNGENRGSIEPSLELVRRKSRTFRFLGFYQEEACE
jgi:prephenate dehydratase/chorismate mutase